MGEESAMVPRFRGFRFAISAVLSLSCCLLIGIACSVIFKQTGLPVTSIDGSPSGSLQIQNWRVYGPFAVPSKAAINDVSDNSLSISSNYMARLGESEDRFDEHRSRMIVMRSIFGDLSAALIKALGQPVAYTVQNTKLVQSRDQFVNLSTELNRRYSVVAYAAAVIESSVPRVVAVYAGSADGMQCWLNNQIVISSPLTVSRSMHWYSDIATFHLHRGRNVLLCKVIEVYDGSEAGWGFRVWIMPLETGRRMINQVPFHPLKSFVILPGERLTPVLDLYAFPTRSRVTITNLRRETIYSASYLTNSGWSTKLPDVPAGVYVCNLKAADLEITMKIYVGNRETVLHELVKKSTHPFNFKGEMAIDVAGWRYRVEHLLEPAHERWSDLNWQRKLVYAMSEIENAQDRSAQRQGDFLREGGFHIRGYQSRIDASTQYYGIHVPIEPSGLNIPLPIAISLLPSLETNRPYLDGFRVSDQDRLEKLNDLSNQYKMIILEPQGRGNASGWPIQEADIKEALQAAEANYAIDKSRVYLVGYCEAGREALLFAEHFPSPIAAVAVYGPTDLPQDSGSHHFSPSGWLADHDVSQLFSNLINIPVLFIQGDRDIHTRLAETQSLSEMCQEAGARCSFQSLAGVGHSDSAFEDIADPMLQFLLLHRKNTNPARISLKAYEPMYAATGWVAVKRGTYQDSPVEVSGTFSMASSKIGMETNNVNALELDSRYFDKSRVPGLSVTLNGKEQQQLERTMPALMEFKLPGNPAEEPGRAYKASAAIADAFGTPIVLVLGTGGGDADREQARAFANRIQEAYYRDFFVRLPETTDTRYVRTKNDRSILVIGRCRSNLPLGRLLTRFLRLTPEGIELNGRFFKGHDLMVQGVQDLPRSKESVLVFLESNGPGPWTYDRVRLWSLEGYFQQRVEDGQDFHVIWEKSLWH